jgi:hypothetical protein
VKVYGTQWEKFIKFAPTTSGYSLILLNGGCAIGSGFMPTMEGATVDNTAALYLCGKLTGDTPGNRGIVTFDGRLNDAKASEDMVVFEYCSGWGNRIAHMTGDGSFYVKGDIEAIGTIKANEVKVQDMTASNITVAANGNTADFVFADDYSLKNLDEVEVFIKANKHLPEMPSAAEMEAQGVNIAEMNKLLLQKVEELTLHLIEKNKEIQAVKEELQVIKYLIINK